MRLVLIGFILILSACSLKKPGGASGYLLPWPTSDGRYSLQVVQIETIQSPNRASGPAAEVFVEPNFTEQGFEGKVAEPQVTEVDGVYVPRNVQSSTALTVYAHFERIYKFELKIGSYNQISWPRRLGIDLQVVNSQGFREHTNARYYGNSDVIGIFPYALDGLPLELNASVLAHEHFHAHFQAIVLQPTLSFYELSALEKASEMTSFNRPETYNFVVLRAWNEGIADFFAGVFTNKAAQMELSLRLPEKDNRDLDGEIYGLSNIEEFRKRLEDGLHPSNGTSSWCQSVQCAYREGTQLARILWQFAGDEREAVLRQVMTRLPYMMMSVQAFFSADFLSLDQAVGWLLQGYTLTPERCKVLNKNISDTILKESFAACVVP